jgi:cysteine desulfurase
MKLPIYLDYSATTPVDPRVAQKMSECLLVDGNFGNPASRSHVFGWKAEEAVENARRQVAELVNADPREIVWTSGATESDNLAIKGVANFSTPCASWSARVSRLPTSSPAKTA